MIKYGQLIDSGFDPQKDNVYNIFTEYFNNPVMTKVKDVDKYSMYIAKIKAMLGNVYRYVIVFVDKDSNEVKGTKPLKDLPWVSFQTRSLEDYHDIPSHSYHVHKHPELMAKIKLTSRDEAKTVYSCEKLPITVTLLHTRKNSRLQYQASGTVVSALETFQTIISF